MSPPEPEVAVDGPPTTEAEILEIVGRT